MGRSEALSPRGYKAGKTQASGSCLLVLSCLVSWSCGSCRLVVRLGLFLRVGRSWAARGLGRVVRFVVGSWSPGGLLLLLHGLGLGRSGPWSDPFLGACSWKESPGDAPETRTGGAALPAVCREPARPCGERRRELASHARGPRSGSATLPAVGTRRRDLPIVAPRGCG